MGLVPVIAPVIRVLGLDPGLTNCGYVVASASELRVVDCGVIGAKPSDDRDNLSTDRERRAGELGMQLDAIVRRWRPTVVYAEWMSFPRGAKAIAAVSLAWGAIATVFKMHGVHVVHVPTADVKAALGERRSTKGRRTKDDDRRLYAGALVRFPTLRTAMLGKITPSLQEHAIDAYGAVMAAVRDKERAP